MTEWTNEYILLREALSTDGLWLSMIRPTDYVGPPLMIMFFMPCNLRMGSLWMELSSSYVQVTIHKPKIVPWEPILKKLLIDLIVGQLRE